MHKGRRRRPSTARRLCYEARGREAPPPPPPPQTQAEPGMKLHYEGVELCLRQQGRGHGPGASDARVRRSESYGRAQRRRLHHRRRARRAAPRLVRRRGGAKLGTAPRHRNSTGSPVRRSTASVKPPPSPRREAPAVLSSGWSRKWCPRKSRYYYLGHAPTDDAEKACSSCGRRRVRVGRPLLELLDDDVLRRRTRTRRQWHAFLSVSAPRRGCPSLRVLTPVARSGDRPLRSCGP